MAAASSPAAAAGASGNEPNYRTKFSELNSVNIAGVPANTVSNVVAASDVRPERQLEMEAGIDATLFGSRANLEFTVYNKRISDLLLRQALPPVTGTPVFLSPDQATAASGYLASHWAAAIG